jgi:hypothetical protein
VREGQPGGSTTRRGPTHWRRRPRLDPVYSGNEVWERLRTARLAPSAPNPHAARKRNPNRAEPARDEARSRWRKHRAAVKSQATALYLPRTGFTTLEDGNRRSGVQAITASSPNPPPESDDAEHEVAREQDHQPEHRSMAALVGFSPRTFRYAAHTT